MSGSSRSSSKSSKKVRRKKKKSQRNGVQVESDPLYDDMPDLSHDSDEHSDDEVYRTKFKKKEGQIPVRKPKRVVEETSSVPCSDEGGKENVYPEEKHGEEDTTDMPGLVSDSDSDDEGSLFFLLDLLSKFFMKLILTNRLIVSVQFTLSRGRKLFKCMLNRSCRSTKCKE